MFFLGEGKKNCGGVPIFLKTFFWRGSEMMGGRGGNFFLHFFCKFFISFEWIQHFFVQGSNEWPGTTHVTLGQMRGLKKTAPNVTNIETSRHPDGHGNSITESTLIQWKVWRKTDWQIIPKHWNCNISTCQEASFKT